MTHLRKLVLALLGALALRAAPAQAVCNQATASQADRDLWNTHGCWQAFFLWQYQAYDMSGSDWGGRGWDDACNVNKEYPKHWNAAYLLTYGLQDNNSFSFHGTADYRGTAERWDNAYHDDLYHAPTDDTSIFGRWSYHFFGSNEVDTSCLLYDPNLRPNANPGSRAGDFEHEGWHGWMDKYDWDNGSCGGHRCGPTGNCTAKGCDYFYFHGIGAYAFGAMWENDGTANRFHSPNQVQVEFLCDVADFPQGWVPNSVRLAAQADANQRASQRFINGPGYFCGNPRPW
jgi:hypothetical protein